MLRIFTSIGPDKSAYRVRCVFGSWPWPGAMTHLSNIFLHPGVWTVASELLGQPNKRVNCDGLVSHPIPSRPFPSHPVPFRPVLSHPIPSLLISSRPVSSHPVPSRHVPSHPVLSRPFPSHPLPSRPVPSPPGEGSIRVELETSLRASELFDRSTTVDRTRFI